MANTLGTPNGTLIAQRTLETLLAMFPVLSQISTDFSDESALFNQTIMSRVIAPTTSADYNLVTGYVPIDRTTIDVPITITAHKHHTYAVNDQERTTTKRNLIEEWAQAGAHALGKTLMDDLCGVITVANFPEVYNSGAATFDREDLILVRKQLNKLFVPDLNRFALLNSDYYGNLAIDTTIVANPSSGAGADTVQTGELPRIHGFAVSEYPALPDNGIGLGGLVGNKEALLIATRLPELPTRDVDVPGTLEVVTNEPTGLSVLLRTWYDMGLGKEFRGLTWMYGVGVGLSEAGASRRAVRIVP